MDGGAAVDGGGADFDDYRDGRGGVGLAPSRVGVGECDVLVTCGAEKAPLGEAPAAHAVWAEEGVGELHTAAEPAIEDCALGDDGDARNLLDGTGKDGDGGGVEVAAVAVLAEPMLWELAKKGVDQVELQESARGETTSKRKRKGEGWRAQTIGPV